MIYNYSIIIPYRDKYELFLKAINSIPDRDDIQVIIVDNAVQPLLKADIPTKQQAKVVYTISSSTKGAGCARNEGLKYVKSKFILFLDADDYFTDDAFNAFDKYINSDYDIVFFKPISMKLSDGSISERHISFIRYIETFIQTGEENRLRYRWEVPWAKLFRADFILKKGFKFDELKVANDVWFSLMAGHNAKKITVDLTEVYVVTEGGYGQSLVKTITKENVFIRYGVAIRVNKFLQSIGQYDMRIRLMGFIRIALIKFGPKEFMRYIKVAISNKTSIF